MTATAIQTARRLPAYLPAVYRDDPFLGQYLWAFEQVLLGLEQQIGEVPSLFDPLETRAEFLQWLSTWVGFTLRSDLDEAQQRAFLAGIVPLYRRRGTRENLQRLLSIFTRGIPTVTESDDDTKPHYFRVGLRLGQAPPDAITRQLAIASALIELEKPAHTHYDLDASFPTMQIAKTSTIGLDTLLGTIDAALSTAAPVTSLASAPSSFVAASRPTDEAPRGKPGAKQPPRSKPSKKTPAKRTATKHPAARRTTADAMKKRSRKRKP